MLASVLDGVGGSKQEEALTRMPDTLGGPLAGMNMAGRLEGPPLSHRGWGPLLDLYQRAPSLDVRERCEMRSMLCMGNLSTGGSRVACALTAAVSCLLMAYHWRIGCPWVCELSCVLGPRAA